MREVFISDITIKKFTQGTETDLTFKEKIELAKRLDRLNVSAIEIEKIQDAAADSLLIKTLAQEITNSSLAVSAGLTTESVDLTWQAMSGAVHPRIQIVAPVSPSRMEYVYHKKGDAMLEMVKTAIAHAKTLCENVEFVANDATGADYGFLRKIVGEAIEAGANMVTLYDSAGRMLPSELKDFILTLKNDVPALDAVGLGVGCSNELGLAQACALAAVSAGADEIKASALDVNRVSLDAFSKLLTEKGDSIGAVCSVRRAEMKKILKEIGDICEDSRGLRSPFDDGVREHVDMTFSDKDDMDALLKGVAALGYDLSESDSVKVWEAFKKVVSKKGEIDSRELDVIVAAEAMQVPEAYILESYNVTTGNTIDVMAHVKLRKEDELLDGISLGDGPIDAGFLAIEKITGCHYELDDFQIQAISEGHEAMGQTLVKLRHGGKVYSGRGTSTDIIASGIRAYINALNKIVYEENNE